ncbi:protein will die slowly-like isoform X2 [Fopius arisanus]|uniref:Protein will die slowly-like isoform X2 n=1 Tax=Fopius arisanus TaxID=64838 RepID=A0A9R1SU87_9HYME|nr:PREDICTED: protein will die slowly-like isoform X2 [Fopius arisanus]
MPSVGLSNSVIYLNLNIMRKSLRQSVISSQASASKSRQSIPRTSTLGPRKLSRKVSYAVVKSHHQAGDVDEDNRLAEVEQGLHLEGDITILSQIEGTQEILCLSYTETFDYLGIGLADGTVRLINRKTGEFEGTLRDEEINQNPGTTTSIKHRPVQGALPVTQTLTATCRCLYTIRENRQTLGLAYHPTLPKFVTVGDDTKLCVYDEETKALERILQASNSPDVMNGHRSRVFAACFNPRSSHEIISGGWDDTIQFWDIREPHASRFISGVHICGDSIDISQDGKEILTCSWSKQDPIKLWDYGTGKLIDTLEPDPWESLLYTGKFVGSSFASCGGCDANLFRIIDLTSKKTLSAIKKLPGGVYDIDVGPPHSKFQKKSVRRPPPPRIAFCSGKTVFEVESNI